MEESLRTRLKDLAIKYETKDFLEKDPSCFMHLYTEPKEQEVVAFLASSLAFGRREQILSHIQLILERANPSPYNWILTASYKDLFIESDKSFYRMFSYHDMRLLCERLKNILQKNDTFGNAVKKSYHNACETNKDIPKAYSGTALLSFVISDMFKGCKIIPQSKDGASKKLQMFLRWMVRDNSPVDLGLWSSWYSKKDLLMPLDTHVMQEACKFSLLQKTKAGKIPAPNLKTAIALTTTLMEVFPTDPVRGDFALFGLGVEQ